MQQAIEVPGENSAPGCPTPS